MILLLDASGDIQQAAASLAARGIKPTELVQRDTLRPQKLWATLARVRRTHPQTCYIFCRQIHSQFNRFPLKLAAALEEAQVPILGTSPDAIDLAEDRRRFQGLLQKLGLKQPENGTATSAAEAEVVAHRIGYPVVIRPSYVLGGRAMEIVHEPSGLEHFVHTAMEASRRESLSSRAGEEDAPILIDQFLPDAIEVDVDVVADGTDVVIGGVMEHIEEAGIHSGDSACCLPPYSLAPETVEAKAA